MSSQCKRVILEEIFTIFLRGKLVLFYKAYYSIVVIRKTLDNYSIGNLADNYSLIILYCNSSEVITSALYKLLDELNKTVFSPQSTVQSPQPDTVVIQLCSSVLRPMGVAFY